MLCGHSARRPRPLFHISLPHVDVYRLLDIQLPFRRKTLGGCERRQLPVLAQREVDRRTVATWSVNRWSSFQSIIQVCDWFFFFFLFPAFLRSPLHSSTLSSSSISRPKTRSEGLMATNASRATGGFRAGAGGKGFKSWRFHSFQLNCWKQRVKGWWLSFNCAFSPLRTASLLIRAHSSWVSHPKWKENGRMLEPATSQSRGTAMRHYFHIHFCWKWCSSKKILHWVVNTVDVKTRPRL